MTLGNQVGTTTPLNTGTAYGTGTGTGTGTGNAGYSNNDTLDLFRTWMLVTVLGSAYIVSRGLAKAGAREGTREYGRDIDLR
jgi:hypothetical protein